MRIDQEYNAINHRQGAFDFAAKIRVSWCIDDVDVRAFPANGTVFGKNSNAAFAFDGIAVHHAFNHFFVLGKSARLAQELVDHSGLAMIDVGDDGDVTDLLSHGYFRGEIDTVRKAAA